MNIESIDGGSLRVWLADEELRQWGLHTDQPDRRLVRRLVRQVTETANYTAPKVVAELIPVMGGGILLIRRQGHLDSGQPLVYRFDHVDTLLDLLAQWPQNTAPPWVLYEVESAYYLVVYPEEPLSVSVRHLLLEYGTPLGGGEGMVAHAAEYGTLIGAGEGIIADAPHPPELLDPEH